MVKAELRDLQECTLLVVIFQDFPVLETAKVKFQHFPGPVRTLYPAFEQLGPGLSDSHWENIGPVLLCKFIDQYFPSTDLTQVQ